MWIVTRLALLICLLVPLATHGQGRIYLVSSALLHAEAEWGDMYEHWGDQFPLGIMLPFPPSSRIQLLIVNPEQRVGPNLRPFRRFAIGFDTGFGMGLASIGRYHILTASLSAFVSPPWVSDVCCEHWTLNVGAQFGAYLMPADFLGVGASFHANGRYHGVYFEVMVRPRWTGFGK